MTLLPTRSSRRRASRRRYTAFLARPCKMRVTNHALLQQKTYGFLDFTSRGAMPEPHCFLTDCALHCSSRAAPLRFQDSLTLKELCRTRSLCGDAQQRRALSLSIHVRRKEEKRLWNKTLLDRASRGDWCARRLLQRKTNASTARVANSLVQHFGSREDAVTHVKDYFVHKFASPSEPSMCFTDLPCTEPDFTPQEVCQAVLQMKTGKTTGMSHVSVELLRCLVALPLGLHALTSMLNAFLRDPSTCSVELAAGWVILLPKLCGYITRSSFGQLFVGKFLQSLRPNSPLLVSFTSGPFQLAALDLSLERASRKPCTLLSMLLSLPHSCPLPLCLSNLICLRPLTLCL